MLVMDDADLTRLREVAETYPDWWSTGPKTVLALLDHIAALTAERDAALDRADDADVLNVRMAENVRRTHARAETAEATVQRVRDLHYRCGADGPDRLLVGDGYCHECVLAWLCPTIAAQTEGDDRG